MLKAQKNNVYEIGVGVTKYKQWLQRAQPVAGRCVRCGHPNPFDMSIEHSAEE
jgi:hypothetical protein